MIFDLFQPPQLILIILNTVLILWLGFLSFQFISLRKHYDQLVGKSNKKDLQAILEELLKSQREQQLFIDKLEKQIIDLETEGHFHIQQIGFQRFNPFSDTGGGQSFALALLDKHKNGVVFSSLHSRDTTRVYAKQVIKGKGKEFPLSEEEEQVVEHAKIYKS